MSSFNNTLEFLEQDQPGRQLAALRKVRSIPLEQIAKDTYLPLNKLAALEKDDYAEVGPDLFITGYIRKYAKTLDQDPEAFVNAYKRATSNAELGQEGVTTSSQDSKSGQSLDSRHQPQRKRFAQLINGVNGWWLILALVVGWLIIVNTISPGKDEAADSRLPISESSTGDEKDAIAPESAETTIVSPEIETETINEDNAQEASPQLDSDSERTSSGIVEDIPASESSDQESQVTESGFEDASQSGLVTENETLDSESDGSISNETGEDLLVVTLSDESWIEVKDATGKVLFAELRNKGDNLQLFGEAPFNIMLGNARAVQIAVNGKIVPTDPSGSRRTLRLKNVGP